MATPCCCDFRRYSISSVSSCSLNLKNLRATTARAGRPTATPMKMMAPSTEITKPISWDDMKAPGGAYPQYVADLPAFRLYEGSGAALIEVRYRCSGLAFLEVGRQGSGSGRASRFRWKFEVVRMQWLSCRATAHPAPLVNLALTAADAARGSRSAVPDPAASARRSRPRDTRACSGR